eukprot:10041864-Ditylum_brightwellii.AAC.1
MQVDDVMVLVYCYEANANKAFLNVFTNNPFKSVTRLASHILMQLFQEDGYNIIGHIGKQVKQPHMKPPQSSSNIAHALVPPTNC